MCGYPQREAEGLSPGTGQAGAVWDGAQQFWHLPLHIPDIWIVLTQLLDICLDLVFFLLPNDIGNVIYDREEPVSFGAL